MSTEVERIAERVRQANTDRRPLRITGARTWKSCAPADASTELPLASLDQVEEYVPGDLTMTVGAGMTLSAIERLTGEHGQWLTLDPFGSPEGTIGATIASASSGPLATGFGTPRDLVIGVQAVMGRGGVVRAGGRVVKNVAGFDITRLLTGSRGTIGAITEVSLRLRARPAADETIAISLPARVGAVREAIGALRGWPAPPMAAELIAPVTGAALQLPAGTTLLIRLGGNARLVASLKKRSTAIGRTTTVDPGTWTRLRALDIDVPVSFRIADLPSAFGERWDDALEIAGESGHVVGSPLRGVVRCMLPSIERSTMSGFRSRVRSATVVYDSLPALAVWNSLSSVPSASTLHARVMEAFDPVGIMNPGTMRLAR